MNKIQTTLFLLTGMAMLAMAILADVSIPPAQAAGDPIVVIVNGSNPTDNLSMAELRRLFTSDRSTWDTGRAVAPVMVTAGAPERTAFLKIVFGMNDADFNKFFLQAAFNGKSAVSPKEVSSAQGVKIVVANSPGAIGFVKARDLNGVAGLKTVKIDGLSASDPGYKLKM